MYHDDIGAIFKVDRSLLELVLFHVKVFPVEAFEPPFLLLLNFSSPSYETPSANPDNVETLPYQGTCLQPRSAFASQVRSQSSRI